MQSFMSYGHWDFYEGIPTTHYLEPAVVNSKRVHFFEEQDEDLFKVQAATGPACSYYPHRDQKKKKQRKKQGSHVYVTGRKPQAVDEDLYKIPPELLYQIPKKKRMHAKFLFGCLGLNCIAIA